MVAKPFDLILKVKSITKTNIGNFKSTILFKLLDDSLNEFSLQFPIGFP